MKAVAYCRVSTDDQQERGTIENQVEFAQKYTDLHQIPLVKIYKDEGISGTIPLEDRPAGKELVEDAKNGNFDTVLVYKLDRLGRSARITLNSIHLLEECAIKIKSMSEPFDTENPTGRFMITMLAGVADLERNTILERMQYGTERAAKAGKWLGGIVPYGYIVNNDKFLEVNETKMPCGYSEADVVRLIYKMLAVDKVSTLKIADFLNDNKIPTHYAKDNRLLIKGKRKEATDGYWRPSRIGNLVKNTVYHGVHQYGKRSPKERIPIEREVPAIVDKSTYVKALETMANNRINAKKNTKNAIYKLRSLIKCGKCGRAYIGTSFKSKIVDGKLTYRAYYVCTGARSKYVYGNEERCTSKAIPSLETEGFVINSCKRIIQNPDLVVIQPKDNTIEIKKIKSTITTLENEKQKMMVLYRKDLINLDDLEKHLLEIKKETKVCLEELKNLEEQDTKETLKEVIADIKNIATEDELIRKMVKRVIVITEDDKIKLRIEYI